MGLLSSLKEKMNQPDQYSLVQYLAGHPSISKGQKVKVNVVDNNIRICDISFIANNAVLGVIDGKDVKNIAVEDKSTMERRVTVGRLLLVGIFAFGWKKKRKENHAYVVIEWLMGDRFSNETIFEFEGKNAMQSANDFRMKLINGIS